MSDENHAALLGRSIRTLAWLGDAMFEQDVRRRIAGRGDLPLARLDAIKAAIVRAESQAEMLHAIDAELAEDERDTVARARNTAVPSSARGRRDTRTYRAASGLEALVAYWFLSGEAGQSRYASVLAPRVENAIDVAWQRLRSRPRRG